MSGEILIGRQPGELADEATLRRLQEEQVRLSDHQLAVVLEKHQLGSLGCAELISAHTLNLVYRITPTRGDHLVLKAQLRNGLGSLQAESYAIRILRDATHLPVSEVVILDDEADVMEWPYLLVSELPGTNCKSTFDDGDHCIRRELSSELGQILRTIHAIPVDASAPLPNDDLSQWPSIVEGIFFGEPSFEAEIAALSPDFLGTLREALASSLPLEEAWPVVLLWRDPAMSNMLLDPGSSPPRISGLFDFQFASHGSSFIDYTIAENGLRAKSAQDGQDTAETITAFRDGYGEAHRHCGDCQDLAARRFDLVNAARATRLWWDWGRILHPSTPERLEMVLASISRIHRAAG